MENWDESIVPLTTNGFLYLSGTPFRAIESGEFIEEQIFNWTYSDEQEAKENWEGENNPYESLPTNGDDDISACLKLDNTHYRKRRV